MPPGTTSSAGSTVLEQSAFFTDAVPADTVEEVFRTLAGPTGPRAYLGVECNDGLEAIERRIVHARNFLDRFGVSHYGGYAFNTEILPQLLTDLRDGADQQAAAMGPR